MCEYRYVGVNPRRFPAAPGSGSPLGRRRVSPTLPISHSPTLPQTHSGLTGLLLQRCAPLPGQGPRPTGSRLFLTAAARHPRAPAPGWAAGGFVAAFFFLFLSFFFFLPVSGWRAVASILRSRRWAPAQSPLRGLGFAKPQPRRTVPAWGQAQALPEAVPRATKAPHLGHATFLPWGPRP